jgi:hypothetical protein
VELHLGKQVGRRDAHEGPAGERHGHPQHVLVLAAEQPQAHQEADRAQRHDERVGGIDDGAEPSRAARGGEQRGDDRGVERLVEEDRQECRQPGERAAAVGRVGPDGGRQGRTVRETVEGQSGERPAPRPAAGAVGVVPGGVGRAVFVAVIVAVFAVGGVVGVAMKGPFQQEHHEEARERPAHRGLHVVAEGGGGVGQKVQQADAEQHAAGE